MGREKKGGNQGNTEVTPGGKHDALCLRRNTGVLGRLTEGA